MHQVSATALQAWLAQQTAEVFVACLKIEHPSLPSTIRLARNTEPLVRADGTYMPYAFTIALPSQRDDEMPQVSVTVDNTDLEVNNALRSLVGAPKVTFDVVPASSPDSSEAGPFEYSLQTATCTADTIQGTLGYEDDVFSQQVPGQNYTPSSSPGLFL